jgi:hypothetical protein
LSICLRANSDDRSFLPPDYFEAERIFLSAQALNVSYTKEEVDEMDDELDKVLDIATVYRTVYGSPR